MAEFAAVGDIAINLDWIVTARLCRDEVNGDKLPAVEVTFAVAHPDGEPRLYTETYSGERRRLLLDVFSECWGWPHKRQPRERGSHSDRED